jgi:hypothetical protein
MVQYIDYSPAEEEVQQPSQVWSPRIVHIRATITGLAPPLIPFAMLKHNPLLEFERSAREISSDHIEEQASAKIALQEAWNKPFAPLEPHQLFFLCAWSSVPGASPKVKNASCLTFAIATPGDDYKRWLTTYAIMRKHELVAWCEEVDMRGVQEKMVEIVLSEEGMIRLPTAQMCDVKVE